MATTYKRVLLKLSGEALKSGSELFDFPMVQHVAQVIRQMHELGTEIGIVIGAGNIWRGRQGPSAHMDAVTADQMGMLGTMINCLCVADALRKEGVDAVVMSAVDMDRFAQPFNAMTAREYLSQGRVVLFGCGSGNPFFSTDTAVALRAIEMQADAILMGKNIDGVYTADPHGQLRHPHPRSDLRPGAGPGAEGHGCRRLRPVRGKPRAHGAGVRPGQARTAAGGATRQRRRHLCAPLTCLMKA